MILISQCLLGFYYFTCLKLVIARFLFRNPKSWWIILGCHVHPLGFHSSRGLQWFKCVGFCLSLLSTSYTQIRWLFSDFTRKDVQRCCLTNKSQFQIVCLILDCLPSLAKRCWLTKHLKYPKIGSWRGFGLMNSSTGIIIRYFLPLFRSLPPSRDIEKWPVGEILEEFSWFTKPIGSMHGTFTYYTCTWFVW